MKTFNVPVTYNKAKNMNKDDRFWYDKGDKLYVMMKGSGGLYIVRHYIYVNGTSYHKDNVFSDAIQAVKFWDYVIYQQNGRVTK